MVMKKHLQKLFDKEHKKKTLTLALFSVILIVLSLIIGTSDNIPGLIVLTGGLVMLFFSFLNPFTKVNQYLALIGSMVVLAIFTFLLMYILDQLKLFHLINEAFPLVIIMFICTPGIITGITGAIFIAIKQRK
jgi:hypothetical protein